MRWLKKLVSWPVRVIRRIVYGKPKYIAVPFATLPASLYIRGPRFTAVNPDGTLNMIPPYDLGSK